MDFLPFLILFFALLLDWSFGEPEILWSRVPHPVVIFGNMISFADKRFNQVDFSDAQRMRNGAAVICVLILFAICLGLFIDYLLSFLGVIGLAVEVCFVFFLLAQKSLYDHVLQVSIGLKEGGLDGGRKAVSLIVGRDPSTLDEEGVARASIETLAENFSDGVVAPAFWYLVFGLPGIFAYKMINTADSMIAYKSERYAQFGMVAAHIDDLANWLPARLSVIFIFISALFISGMTSAKAAVLTAMQDAGLHRSPNAGWPEAAMAGALNIALGGPRIYKSETVQQAFLNGAGKREIGTNDIADALKVFRHACFSLMGFCAICVVILFL